VYNFNVDSDEDTRSQQFSLEVAGKINWYYVGQRGGHNKLLQFDVQPLPSGISCPSSSTSLAHFLFVIFF
jgi:hypothetical protein